MKYDVFISYRRDGGDSLASYFKNFLESNGFTVFFDLQEKYTGDFREYITKAIKSSDSFLLILSEGSLEKLKLERDVVKMELEVAFDNNIPIIPISTYEGSTSRKIDEIGLPESLKDLRNQNFRNYNHKTQTDTLDFILGVCKKIRADKFKLKVTKQVKTTGNMFEYLNRFDEVEELKMEYIEKLKSLTSINITDSYFTGTLKDGYPYGHCIIEDLNKNTKYEIDFIGTDTLDGEGRVYKDGELIYDGSIRDFQPYGFGISYKESEIFKGTIYGGQRVGEGIIEYNNGDRFEGTFINGLKHSIGHMKFENGDEYKGSFYSDRLEGQGILLKSNGDIYEGKFFRGEFEDGVIVKNGKVYKGRKFKGKFDSYSGEVSVYDENTGMLLMKVDYLDGEKHGNGTNIKLGSQIQKTMEKYMNVEQIGYTLELKDDEYYIIKSKYKEGKRLNSIEIINKQGESLFAKYDSSPSLFYKDGNIVKSNKTINIKENNNSFIIHYKGELLNLRCKYESNENETNGEFKEYGNLSESMDKGFEGIEFDLIENDFKELSEGKFDNFKRGGVYINIKTFKNSRKGICEKTGKELNVLEILTDLPDFIKNKLI